MLCNSKGLHGGLLLRELIGISLKGRVLTLKHAWIILSFMSRGMMRKRFAGGPVNAFLWRKNGNSLQEAGSNRKDILGEMNCTRTESITVISGRVIFPERIRRMMAIWAQHLSIRSRRMDTGFTIWQEMCGNGVLTGLASL